MNLQDKIQNYLTEADPVATDQTQQTQMQMPNGTVGYILVENTTPPQSIQSLANVIGGNVNLKWFKYFLIQANATGKDMTATGFVAQNDDINKLKTWVQAKGEGKAILNPDSPLKIRINKA